MPTAAWMLLAATVAAAPVPPVEKAADVESLSWAQRAEDFVASLDQPLTARAVWLGVAEASINAGDADRADRAIAHFKEHPSGDAQVRLETVMRVASSGDDARAVEFARRIESTEQRDSALYWIAVCQAQRGQFEAAKKTVEFIETAEHQNYAWSSMMLPLASRRQYKEAREAAAHLIVAQGKWKDEANALLAAWREQDAESGSRTGSPPFRGTGYGSDPYVAARYAMLAGDPLLIYLDDLAKSEESARQSASRWLQMAWEYHDRGLIEQRDRAIGKTETLVHSASLPNAKADGYALLADLAVEAGQAKQAREFLAMSQKVASTEERRPADNARYPLWIGTLVRLGDLDAAFAAAKDSPERLPRQHWQTLGEMAAYQGKAGEIEKRLAAIPDDLARAMLCVGVASGLQKRKVSGRLKAATPPR